MIPNGAAYNNFPPFATNGTKTPPGGSPESAKYALGMVPADTFPAEWANYLFHGATAGITRLNADTGSIKKEINSVLDNFNITPDGTLTDQLMTALNKLKAEAALAAHPVGSLYWTSSSENPAVTFGGGTWVQIKDRFVYAKGDSDTVNATGGAKTVTLSEANMPSHNHSTFIGGASGSISGAMSSWAKGWNGSQWVDDSLAMDIYWGGNSGSNYNPLWHLGFVTGGSGGGVTWNRGGYSGHVTPHWRNNDHCCGMSGTNGWGGEILEGFSASFNHAHEINASVIVDFGIKHSDWKGSGTAFDKMPPYICKYCWERVS